MPQTFSQNNHPLRQCGHLSQVGPSKMSQPHFGQVWGYSPTLPKLGIWSPPGLPNV